VSDRIEAAIRELAEALREDLAAEARLAGPGLPDRLYSVDEAAALLGIGRTALYGEIQAGRCRSLKVGRRRLVPSSAISDYANGGRDR
jgi:excisionase family DNA binding protein